MKPAAVLPVEGEFDFRQADAFVDFGVSNRLKIVGHCLVWAKDDRTPQLQMSLIQIEARA